MVEQEFVPDLRQNPGFHSYYLIDCESPESGNVVISLTIFDTWEAALSSNDRAKTFVKKWLAETAPDHPYAVGGEVIFVASRDQP